jgi:large subunit ribosomal protein L20
MARVKRGTTIKASHKKLLGKAKGFRHTRKSVVRLAKQAVMKAEAYAYRSRRLKKRDFRRLWIVRINAACKANGIAYSRFIKLLNDKNIPINRKELSVTAQDAAKFKELVEKAKA